MAINEPLNRKLRMALVGGGQGAFIGRVHATAAIMDNRAVLVAGALSSDPARAKASAPDYDIKQDRAYGSYKELVAAEAKLPAGERVDFISIATPNHTHFEIARAAAEAGFNIMCDKPMTFDLAQAEELAKIVQKTGVVFGLTHNYTGYPMVRQARALVADGQLGRIRVVQVEFAQDWLTERLEETGQKQAAWRTDPAQSGPAGCLGDIASHAYNLARFVTGLGCEAIAADLSTFVPGRRLDDNVNMLLRLSGGARGMLWASQVAPGNENNLRLRVYGERAGLDWRQEDPNYLWLTPHGKPPQLLRRAGAGAGPAAAHATRIPPGHPEGYLEAFAQLYADLAERIAAHRDGRSADPVASLVPGVEDGVEGVRFIEAALKSSRADATWVTLG
jgi:predicted dehydrogenase